MTRFESKWEELKVADTEVFAFLSDFRNFEALMPEQITHWNANADSCSFTIPGMADLAMRMTSKVPCKSILIESVGSKPIAYNLLINIQPLKVNHSTAQIAIEAELNPFMGMMASKPLQNLVDLMAKRLQEHFK